MKKIDKLLRVDTARIAHKGLREQVEKYLAQYEEAQDKEQFIKTRQESLDKLLKLIKGSSPDALKTEKPTKKIEQSPKETLKKKNIKKKKKKAAKKKLTLAQINTGLEKLSECDAELKELRKVKREEYGEKKPEPTFAMRLQQRLNSLANLLLLDNEEDRLTIKRVKMVVFAILKRLENWFPNKEDAIEAATYFKEKFDKLMEKAETK